MSWVEKSIHKKQRQSMKSTDEAPSPSSTTDASATPLTNSGPSRSKARSTFRSKAQTRSKSRYLFRSQSPSPSLQKKRPSIPASQDSPSPYKKALLGKPATTTATTEHKQPLASGNSKAKAESREVSWGRSQGQLISPKPSPEKHVPPPPPLNTNSDPFPEIAQLRRDLEACYAQMVESVAFLPNYQAVWPQPPLTGARRTHPYSRPTTSSHEDDGAP
ncbi:hypothetical protein HPB51_013519 [Rhipicephalus microplus]|uniref:Uncharacterized protein n=1 Tax=Rhipicephalus microplus TaxID=6941 RepID=A0A9J6E1W8_RHIMP|nr:hypothetical protein HPB51_013519 [Rhipicephalus microplus]